MTDKDWPVTQKAIHPDTHKPNCDYCGKALGQQHDKTCIYRRRTVVVSVCYEVVIDVPEAVPSEGIAEHLTPWMALAAAAVAEHKAAYANGAHFTGAFVREATDEDEQQFQVTMDDIRKAWQ